MSDQTATLGVLYAGYDQKRGRDDIVYMSVNVYWEDVSIRLPELPKYLSWYVTVDTSGDGKSRFCYRCGERSRVEGTYLMRPRSVAVFTVINNQGN